jgi:hypothetical protein
VSKPARLGAREIKFQTYFIPPDFLRLDWVRPHPYPPLGHIQHEFSIRSSGKGARYRWEQGPTGGQQRFVDKPMAGLDLAVAAGVASSHGVTFWMHQLLFPKAAPTGAGLWGIVHDLQPQTMFSGTLECHVLRGGHNSRYVEFWFDTGRYALQKAIVRTDQTVSEVRLDVSAFDEPIDPSMFDF